MADKKRAVVRDVWKRFRITNPSAKGCTDVEFVVEWDATEDEIAQAAANAVSEWLSYGWEEIVDGE